MADSEYQDLLALAESMTPRDASSYFFNLASQWYNMQNGKAFKAFGKHINAIIKLMSSPDKRTRLDAIRTIAFVAACPQLHRQMFSADVLDLMGNILGSSPEAANCEAAGVALNHLCSQSSKQQKVKFDIVASFCKNKDSLLVIFCFGHVEDRNTSIISHVMSVLTALCTDRRMSISLHAHFCIFDFQLDSDPAEIQEQCIRAGIVERAYNLLSLHRDRLVHNNVKLFLEAMLLDTLSVDTFYEMYAVICSNMGCSSRALSIVLLLFRSQPKPRYRMACEELRLEK